ncbi:hypothetical protein BCR44DRAFT_1427313, partial [Catenaria anguillulae PL171]
PPPLPIELAQLILLFVPVRFPLGSLTGTDQAIHTTCAAALTALPLPPSYLAVYLRPLATRDTFKAMLAHNRVDLVDWWAFTAKLEAPPDPVYRSEDSLAHHALAHKAWDALAWIAHTGFLEVVDLGLSEDQLCDLVADGGDNEVQLVETWLRSSMSVFDGVHSVAVPACATAYRTIINYCFEEAVRNGHTHVLEWMGTKAGWYLENVVEWACEYVRLDVLEWFKNSKQWVDPDDGWPRYPPEGKPDHFAMDAASMQGKLKVLDWIADNAPVVPLLYTRMAIESACASGNLNVLKWWHSRVLQGRGDSVRLCVFRSHIG